MSASAAPFSTNNPESGGGEIVLDLSLRSPRAEAFRKRMLELIVGQVEAVDLMTDAVERAFSPSRKKGRPVFSAIFLGQTGVGKTRVLEAAVEALYGEPRPSALVKIDCGEYTDGHEVSKLTGAAPSFLGHKTTPALLRQEALNAGHTEEVKITFLLFDEIEKAGVDLHDIVLGILDKATLTLGDAAVSNFENCILVFTSNLGSEKIAALQGKRPLGFGTMNAPAPTYEACAKQAIEAAKRKFRPEFWNRLDAQVVFRNLDEDSIRKILAIEIDSMARRMELTLRCEGGIEEQMVAEAMRHKEYGARELNRVLLQKIDIPLTRALASAQLLPGEVVIAKPGSGESFTFSKPIFH